MKPLVCSILISMMIVFLGCDTPHPQPVSRKTPVFTNKEIETEQSLSKKYTLTPEDHKLLDAAWGSRQLNEENWDFFLERVKNEPDPTTAVKNALDSSFKARFRRSRTKWRRQLTPP